jgi:hypothetical protein
MVMIESPFRLVERMENKPQLGSLPPLQAADILDDEEEDASGAHLFGVHQDTQFTLRNGNNRECGSRKRVESIIPNRLNEACFGSMPTR